MPGEYVRQRDVAGRAVQTDVVVMLYVAFWRILQGECNVRPLLPFLQPQIPGNPAVILIDFAVPFSPAVELAGRDLKPPMNRPAPISVLSDRRRTKSTIWSRVSCGTQTLIRVP
jgi:hypothetical protein